MVCAVTGTSLVGADGVFAYDGAGYVPIAPATLTTCAGAWAYFSQQTTVTLVSTPAAHAAPGSTQTCALQAGWNLVGNPTSESVGLPPDVTAYHWNPQTGA